MKKSFLFRFVLICLVLYACSGPDNQLLLCIQKGDFEATIVESGELLAVNARSVLVPYVGWKYGWQFKITGLQEHGAHVSQGDSVAQIDPANILKFMVEQETRLETEKANLNKLVVEHNIKFDELNARKNEVQADYNLKKLEIERFEFESQRKKEVKLLEYQQAEINLLRIERAMELEKTICENAHKIQKIKVSQLENDLEEARAAVDELKITSPIEGIFQISKNRRSKRLYRLGDDTYQGAELGLVPDLRLIKVKSTINETDIGKVKAGQKVVVRLEAFPDKPFTGKISEIGKLSYNKEEESSVKVFDLETILDTSDPVLKPGMTVSCEVYYAELKDVLFVDNSCLKKIGDTYYLSMKEKEGWSEKPVAIGPRNNKYTVIYGDFKAGTALEKAHREVIARNQ